MYIVRASSGTVKGRFTMFDTETDNDFVYVVIDGNETKLSGENLHEKYEREFIGRVIRLVLVSDGSDQRQGFEFSYEIVHSNYTTVWF